LTAIETAIQKAISNGWRKDLVQQYEDLACSHTKPLERIIDVPKEKIFIDPAFWQALGKAMGWGILYCERCNQKAIPVREKESDPEYWKDCCPKKKLSYGQSSLYHQHRFIDHLAEGKDAESFFEKLISLK